MYSLKDAWLKMYAEEPVSNWDGKLYCKKTDADVTFRANETHGYIAAYTFTLVTEGWLSIVYNDKQLMLLPNDIYIYSPGLSVTIVDASPNYHGICLMADEHVTLDAPSVHDLVHMAYLPIVQLHQPKLTLSYDDAMHMQNKMLEIIDYLHSDHTYKAEVLRMLYAVFLLDLQNVQDKVIRQRTVSQRVEEIFISFIRLLPKYFASHHDIAFYADALHISPVYLSRIVRQVAGRTVIDYVNQFLVMEASFLLRTSNLSIVQIAEQLHFADLASFSKFFLRLKGQSPRDYREG